MAGKRGKDKKGRPFRPKAGGARPTPGGGAVLAAAPAPSDHAPARAPTPPLAATFDGPTGPVSAGVSPPSIDVLMPTYNRAALLGPAIESVLSQSHRDFRLLIRDDGSTDDTAAVAARYVAADPRVHFLRGEKNLGRSGNRDHLLAASTADFIIWVADDDLLAPETLLRYVETLAAHPETDVLYGDLQMFDGETGEDRDIFRPNDWTHRPAHLLGAKLYGSCIPDGGSLVRRALLTAAGGYVPEFVRAQDYEMWTRIAPSLRPRKLDGVVYRYRRHDGSVSFGQFIDLTYDSKIIRRLLGRHPLERLFLDEDWSQPEAARGRAYRAIGENLLLYQDPHNARMLLDAVPGGERLAEVLGVWVRAALMAGDRAGARAAVARYASLRRRETAVVGLLRARIEQADALAAALEAAVGARDFPRVEALVRESLSALDLTFDAMYWQGRAMVAAGQPVEALPSLWQAVRLAPKRADAFEAAVAARETARRVRPGIDGPKVDVESMRRRLLEPLYVPVAPTAVDRTSGPLVSVLFPLGDAGVPAGAALASALAQTWRPIEVVVVGADAGARVAAVAEGALAEGHGGVVVRALDGPADWAGAASVALDAAHGEWIAWLDTYTELWPGHVASLVAAAQAEDAPVVVGELLAERWADAPGGAVETLPWTRPSPWARSELLAADAVPLPATLHRADAVTARPDPELGRSAGWAWLLAVTAVGPVARAHTVTGARVQAPKLDPADLRAQTLAIYRRHLRETLFDRRARAAQNRALAALGVALPTMGLASVVLVGAPADHDAAVGGAQRLAALLGALDRLEASTPEPCEVVVVADAADSEMSSSLQARRAEREHMKVALLPQRLSDAKRVNWGLSLASGDVVALVTPDVTLPEGWLGRLCWWEARAPQTGVVVPSAATSGPLTAEAPTGEAEASRIDGGCVLIGRAVLDRVGGLDAALAAPALAWDDFHLRTVRAGFDVVGAPEVGAARVDGRRSPPGITTDATDDAARARFAQRWGIEPGCGGRSADGAWIAAWQAAARSEPFDPARDSVPIGAEQGFRPDARPVEVAEAAARNVLTRPPADGIEALARLYHELPGGDWALWVRVAPGEQARWMRDLAVAARRLGAESASRPRVLIVGHRLAPDREAGLYAAVDAVFALDEWPDADTEARRAADCGRMLLRTAAELAAWITG